MSAVVVDAVEHLVRGIVDNPDDVRVDMVTSRRGRTVEVHVHPDDLGKVIGRGGRTATALRTLSPASAAGASASTWWTPTSSGTSWTWYVGRVAKAHGITGEIVVEIRTDDPETRFAPGSSLRGSHVAGARNVATSWSRSASTAGDCWCGSTGVADRNAAERCGARCSSSIPRNYRRLRIPTSSTTISSKGCA